MAEYGKYWSTWVDVLSNTALLPTGGRYEWEELKHKEESKHVYRKAKDRQENNDMNSSDLTTCPPTENCVHAEHTAGGFKETKAAPREAPLSGSCNRPDSCSREQPYVMKYHSARD